MEIIRKPKRMTAWVNSQAALGKTICLVPTMGYLHDGHLALVRKGCEWADHVVVSLFVNPIQFGPGEDLDSYPRSFERDAALSEKVGASVLFSPEAIDLYPKGFQTTVTVKGLTSGLCGGSRPHHFDGVTTVVAKLFHIVKPHSAVFGQKDLQQLAVIKKMVSDLNWDIDILGHPIVREADGLAMSSRNSYLNEEERLKALCLHDAIQFARKKVRAGSQNAASLEEDIECRIRGCNGVVIDYVSIVNAETLQKCSVINNDSVLALAVKIGRTRLIDNGFLKAEA
ncbi:MAG: pantoate--beta-alanine ligase [Desulfobulbaceae bacterium]|uniref:Pantothenate synthetase n=1 Tax=Candidatus Desulfobia pelagia TaxID=2841692 RepID=A0A8J6NHN8_9BACT|nr:pantoate--beta-alanine ligase [Candidatus Desulfobia pelagia]